MLSGQADVGIASLLVPDSLDVRELLRDEFRLLWPWEGRDTPPSWLEMAGRPLLLGASDCVEQIERHGARHGSPLGDVQRVEEDSVLLSMVEHGLGIGILAALALAGRPPGVAMYPLPVPLHRSLGVFTRREFAASPLGNAFLTHLRENVASLPEVSALHTGDGSVIPPRGMRAGIRGVG